MSLPATLRELLAEADRHHLPGAAPLVSLTEDEDPAVLAWVRAHGRILALERRSRWHGHLALLPREGELDEARLLEAARGRWARAEPIHLPGVGAELAAEHADWLAALDTLHPRLQSHGELEAWVAERLAATGLEADLLGSVDVLFDPERDLEQIVLEARGVEDEGGPVDDLWLKTGKLSTDPKDHSLRLRFSHGREGDDDASADSLRNDLVAELARSFLPVADWLEESGGLACAEEAAGEALRPTQHILYWNAPGGGALFHHDAFDEPYERRQRGVLYQQLTGSTLWLALSLEDLMRRVRELFSYLGEGEMAWLREELEQLEPGWQALWDLVSDEGRLRGELALPGCGLLAPVVNRGPEFTALLADAGHAQLLEAGDAVLLPNHGFERTAMHSVFCASDATGAGLSVALRDSQ